MILTYYIYIYIYIFSRGLNIYIQCVVRTRNVSLVTAPKKKKKTCGSFVRLLVARKFELGLPLNQYTSIIWYGQPASQDRSITNCIICAFVLVHKLCAGTNNIAYSYIWHLHCYTYFLFLLIKLQVMLTSVLKNQFQENFNITFMENVKSYQNINYFFFFHKNFL